jgi:hypothetical protein
VLVEQLVYSTYFVHINVLAVLIRANLVLTRLARDDPPLCGLTRPRAGCTLAGRELTRHPESTRALPGKSRPDVGRTNRDAGQLAYADQPGSDLGQIDINLTRPDPGQLTKPVSSRAESGSPRFSALAKMASFWQRQYVC